MSLHPTPPPPEPPSRIPPSLLTTSASINEYHAQVTKQLDAYYDRTQLLAVIAAFMRSLTQRFATHRLVPLNPYASLLSHIRQAEISTHELLQPRDLKSLTSSVLLFFEARDSQIPLPDQHQIATFKTLSPAPTLAVWATRAVLEQIPYSADWQRGADALYELCSPWLCESEGTDDSHGVVSVGAMVGANVFFLGGKGDKKDVATLMELERHIIVTGGQLESAMAVFARQQIRSLFEATKKLGVRPLVGGGQLTMVGANAIVITLSHDAENSVWTLERATANRQAFVTAVKLALIASGSFAMDLLYEHRVGAVSDGAVIRVVRCTVKFFFHFDASPAPPVTQRRPTANNRSFIGRSRVEQSGICWSTHAAHEITRRTVDQRARDAETMAGAVDLPPIEKPSLLTDLVSGVSRLTRSNAETCHWLGLLPFTEAWRLVQIDSLIDLMVYTIRTAPRTSLSRLIDSSALMYNDAIAQLVQDACVGRSSSLLHGLSGILRDLCGLPEDPLDSENIDALYQCLQRSQETIGWLASAAVRDLRGLVQRTISPTAAQTDSGPCADLRADIAAAIDDRRFPLAIAAESVFAQYTVKINLDSALERSLVNTVVSGLPPNPCVAFCTHIRVFASQHVDAQECDRVEPSLTDHRSCIRSVDSALFAIDLPATVAPGVTVLVSANERLLNAVSIPRILAIHRYLTEQQVYRPAAYHPSKATYSARVVTSLLVDDPLLLSTAELQDRILLQSIEVVEYVVIEGGDFAQALHFFADAVRHDVIRLVDTANAEMQLLDPTGVVVTTVELQDPQTQTFHQLVVEAIPKQCVLQIVLSSVVNADQACPEPMIRLVTKKYVFRHQATEPSADSHASYISDAFQQRLRLFSVGFNIEAAQTTWDLTGEVPPTLESEYSMLTAFTARALKRHDVLLLNHLDQLTSCTAACSTPEIQQPGLIMLLRLLDMERVLEWLLHRLVFQQQTSLTPRSETAALAAEATTLLLYITTAIEQTTVPRVDAMGMVDAQRIFDVMVQMRSFCEVSPRSDSDEAVTTAERFVRQLWTLVLIVRFAAQADLSHRKS